MKHACRKSGVVHKLHGEPVSFSIGNTQCISDMVIIFVIAVLLFVGFTFWVSFNGFGSSSIV